MMGADRGTGGEGSGYGSRGIQNLSGIAHPEAPEANAKEMFACRIISTPLSPGKTLD